MIGEIKMAIPKGWMKEQRGSQINYIRLKRTIEDVMSNRLTFIVIQEIPIVHPREMRITGYTYSVKTNKKWSRWMRFKTKTKAIEYVHKLMKKG